MIHKCTNVCVCVCLSVCLSVCVSVCVHVYMCARVHVQVCMCTYDSVALEQEAEAWGAANLVRDWDTVSARNVAIMNLFHLFLDFPVSGTPMRMCLPVCIQTCRSMCVDTFVYVSTCVHMYAYEMNMSLRSRQSSWA